MSQKQKQGLSRVLPAVLTGLVLALEATAAYPATPWDNLRWNGS